MSDLVNVRGLAELQTFLSQLPAKMEANIMRSALRAGANVIRNQARANVPAKSGKLRAGIMVSTRSRRGVVTATIRSGGPHAYIGRFLEYGVAPHFIGPKNANSLLIAGALVSGVDHPGIAPMPYMRRALDTEAQAALVAVGNAIKKRLTNQGINTTDIDVSAE